MPTKAYVALAEFPRHEAVPWLPQSMAKVSSGESRSGLKRQAILILGMYRSGGSPLAGVVRSLGAAAPKTLMMPDSGNPSGYWESVPLANAHDELLASAGSRWNDWRQLDPKWVRSDAAPQFKARIKEILQNEYGDAPLSVIKDPRVCRFVPFMSAILGEMKIGAVAFLMLRNPLDIALSLRQREGIALPRGLMLWLRHMLDAEHHSRLMPRYFLTYEDLLMDWRPHLDRAIEKVGIVWPARCNMPAATIERFQSLDLHHERRTSESLEEHPDVSSLVGDTYRILRIMSADGESQGLIDQLDLIRAKFEEGCKIFGPMIVSEESAIEQLRGEIGQRAAESDRLHASLEQQRIQWMQHDASVRQMHEVLSQKDSDNQRLISDLSASATELQSVQTAASKQIAVLNNLLKESEADRAARLEQITALNRLLKESEADRTARFEQIEILMNSLKTLEAERAAGHEQVQVLNSRLRESEADRSARLEQIKFLTNSIKTLEAERAAGHEQVQVLNDRLKESETDRAARLEQIKILANSLKESEAGRLALREELQATLANYQMENRTLKDGIDSLYNSLSWRMTRPLRAISLFIRGNVASTPRE
jgi:hypothetical protein